MLHFVDDDTVMELCKKSPRIGNCQLSNVKILH